MSIPKVVYVVNAKAGTVDAWVITGELVGIFNGKKEPICILVKGRKSCALPKRCTFETEEAALAVLNRK